MDQFFCHSKIVEIQKTFKIENIFKSENFLIRKNHKQNYNPNSSKPQLNKSNIENQHPGYPNLSKMKYNKADSKNFNFQDANFIKSQIEYPKFKIQIWQIYKIWKQFENVENTKWQKSKL